MKPVPGFGVGVGVGAGVGVGVGVGDGAGVGVGVGAGVGVGVGEGAAVGVGVGVGRADGVGVGPGVGMTIGVGVGVGNAVAAAEGDGVAVELAFGPGACDGFGLFGEFVVFTFPEAFDVVIVACATGPDAWPGASTRSARANAASAIPDSSRYASRARALLPIGTNLGQQGYIAGGESMTTKLADRNRSRNAIRIRPAEGNVFGTAVPGVGGEFQGTYSGKVQFSS